MRKFLAIIGVIAGGAVLAIVAILTYAYFSLNSIIASSRGYIVARVSDAIGRPVEVQDIKATIGWGVKIDVSGVKVADDPNFSQLPFVQVKDILVNVELVPLLSRSLRVTSLVLDEPELRILRAGAGTLNIATIGPQRTLPQTEHPGAAAGSETPNVAGLTALTVSSLRIENGRLSYAELGNGRKPIQLNQINLAIDHFNLDSPFDVALSLTAIGPQRDLAVSGQAGPLMRQGQLEIGAIPINLDVTIGPIAVAQLQALPPLARAIPADLSISQPITIHSKITGTSDTTEITGVTDLTAAEVVYSGILDKPANVPLRFTGWLSRARGEVRVKRAELVLATVKANATDLILKTNNLATRVDTNNFDVARISKVLTLAQRYNPTGSLEVHGKVRLADGQPSATGTVTMSNISATFPGNGLPVKDFTGVVQLTGDSANVGPISFRLGSRPARLELVVQSLRPPRASYQLSAATISVGDLLPTRRALGEHLDQLAANGNLSRGAAGAISATTNLTSVSGVTANLPYQNLSLIALYESNRLTINSMKLSTFDGSVGASGVANLGGSRNFNLRLTAANLNLQKALMAQKAKAADLLRGLLTGIIQVAGAGDSFDQMRPTLHGNGSASLKNGKLIGVNIVGQALQKINNLPAIGALVPPEVAARHPDLFRSNDAALQNASLTFTMRGPRLTTHDLTLTAVDYSVLANGWIDMDKNVDLAAHILLSKALSSELIAAKHNVAYITDPDQRVEIPLRVMGRLPKPTVIPDVGLLAQRAATHAAQREVGRLLRKKGGALGRLLGGDNTNPQPSNPLNELKGLFK